MLRGLNIQTVNDLLSMYVGAASQHALRMSFVPEQEAQNFDRQVLTFWSRLMHRDITSQLPFSTSQAWRFWCGFCCSKTCCSSMACVAVSHPFIDDYHPFSGHRFALSLYTNITCSTHPTSIHNLPTNEQTHLPTQTTRGCFTPSKPPKRNKSPPFKGTFTNNYITASQTPTERAILLSQSTSHTGAHLMQPSSEAYEIEDRCFRVSVARRLMLPHPVAANPADVVQFCPNKSAAGYYLQTKPLDPKLHHCYGCRYGGGVDRRHAALARCLSDIIQSHSGVKVFIEQEVPALTRVVNGQTEHARMDLFFLTSMVLSRFWTSLLLLPFSCNPSLVAAAITKTGLMAKRAEKTKFDKYPHINLIPFILETTGRPGSHAKK